MKTFNPKAYVVKSSDNVEKYEARKKWRDENAHLALPFFVEGLRGHIPPVFPQELALLGAASGEGKSYALRIWHSQSERMLSESKRRAVTAFVSQEETTERMIDNDITIEGAARVASKQTVWIGANWGMNADDIDDLHMTNVITALTYAKNSFAEPMPFASIFYDYIQATPADPHRRNQMTEELRRLQVADDTRRLFSAAKTFHVPVITAAQTMLKKLNAPYNKAMLIPSKRDFEEGAGIFQVPDYVYSLWLARGTHPVGKKIEIDKWSFTVEKNLVFLWFLKARGHNPETAKGVNRVFPLRIINDEYVYDPEYHKSMIVGVDNE